MAMDKDQAIRKAQKLMAVAMDGRGNTHEAERALVQAETLMRKFGLEQADVAATKAGIDFDWADAFHANGPTKNPAKSCPRWGLEAAILAHALAHAASKLVL